MLQKIRSKLFFNFIIPNEIGDKMNKVLAILLGIATLSFAPVITGCDRKVDDKTTYHKDADGTVHKDSKTVKTNNDGDVTKTEKHEVDRP